MARSGNPHPTHRFAKGNRWRQSTNGLPGKTAFANQLKQFAEDALLVLWQMMRDESEKGAVRYQCATYLIDRAHGKTDSIDISPQECITALSTAQLEQMILAETKRLEAKL